MSYSLVESNKHCLVYLNDEFFEIDTGSEVSFYTHKKGDEILIDGNYYSMKRCPLKEEEIESYEKLIGNTISGVIGCDILSKTNLTINVKKNKIDFEALPIKHGETVNFEYSGLVKVEVGYNGKMYKALLDTGAWMGYATYDITNNLVSAGKFSDYNSQIGIMEGDFYNVMLTIGVKGRNYSVARAPEKLDVALKLKGCDFVIGVSGAMDKAISFDFKKKEITFK